MDQEERNENQLSPAFELESIGMDLSNNWGYTLKVEKKDYERTGNKIQKFAAIIAIQETMGNAIQAILKANAKVQSEEWTLELSLKEDSSWYTVKDGHGYFLGQGGTPQRALFNAAANEGWV